MKPRISLLALLSVMFILGGCAPAPEEQAEPVMQETLEGAWEITEESFESPAVGWTNRSPQPSLYIFAKQHYSIMLVPSGSDGRSQPRELFSGDEPVLGSAQPTDAEKVAAFDSFIANSGTYEVSNSSLTTRPMVAKTPNFMSSGALTYIYQIEGDSLRLTLTPPWAPDTEQSLTLVRLE